MTYSWLQSLIDIALIFVLVWGWALVDSAWTAKRFGGLTWREALRIAWKQ